MRSWAWLAIAAVISAGGMSLPQAARAQDDLAAGDGYGSDNLSFGRWCSEIQKYPSERCAAKGEADVAAYEDTKAKIQKFEVDHAKEQRQEREFRRDLDVQDKLTPLNRL